MAQKPLELSLTTGRLAGARAFPPRAVHAVLDVHHASSRKVHMQESVGLLLVICLYLTVRQ